MANEVVPDISPIRWVLSGLLNAVFLVAWTLTQWGVSWVIEKFPLSGLDRHVSIIMQWGFAITTLLPILFYIWYDTVTMYYRARSKIREAAGK